jgi:hypothetical protein
VIETSDAESAKYKIDDEIEDLDTIITIKLTVSSSDTSQVIEKAADSGPTGLTGFLLTPEQTPIPDSLPPIAPTSGVNSSTSSRPIASAPPISAEFNVQNILPKGSTRKRKPRQQIYVT